MVSKLQLISLIIAISFGLFSDAKKHHLELKVSYCFN